MLRAPLRHVRGRAALLDEALGPGFSGQSGAAEVGGLQFNEAVWRNARSQNPSSQVVRASVACAASLAHIIFPSQHGAHAISPKA